MNTRERTYNEKKFWDIVKCLDYLNGVAKKVDTIIGNTLTINYQRKENAKVAGIRDGYITLFPSENRAITNNLILNDKNLRELLFN